MKAFLERWLEPKADAPGQVEEIGEAEVAESLSQEEALADEEKAKVQAVQVCDDEIAWRVEVFRQQIPAHGAIPFLVARKSFESPRGCCLSCGDPLEKGDAYRCAACGRAANLALEMSFSLSKIGIQDGGQID